MLSDFFNPDAAELVVFYLHQVFDPGNVHGFLPSFEVLN